MKSEKDKKSEQEDFEINIRLKPEKRRYVYIFGGLLVGMLSMTEEWGAMIFAIALLVGLMVIKWKD